MVFPRRKRRRKSELITHLLALFLTFGCVSAAPLSFESGKERTALIELFTSEGCSSCPPADAWISRLKSDPGLWKQFVPVVFHVDYWDNLGWPDHFALPENAERQRRYSATWGSSSVYTPGFVLNGLEWREWSQAGAPRPATPANVGKLILKVDSGEVEISFDPADSSLKSLNVELAVLGCGLESDVRRGENQGRKLRHDFTVLRLVSVPLKRDGNLFHGSIPLPEESAPGGTALAGWITDGKSQAPIQTTGGWLQRP
jgi:hypothetical protein